MGDHPGGQVGWLATGRMGSVPIRRLTFAVSGSAAAADEARPFLDLPGAGDLRLAAASEHEVPMPVAALVHQIAQNLVGQGYGEQDFAAVLELQARAAGLELVSENAEVADGFEAVGDAGETPGDAAVSTG